MFISKADINRIVLKSPLLAKSGHYFSNLTALSIFADVVTPRTSPRGYFVSLVRVCSGSHDDTPDEHGDINPRYTSSYLPSQVRIEG